LAVIWKRKLVIFQETFFSLCCCRVAKANNILSSFYPNGGSLFTYSSRVSAVALGPNERTNAGSNPRIDSFFVDRSSTIECPPPQKK
jgi:hypothetical protein